MKALFQKLLGLVGEVFDVGNVNLSESNYWSGGGRRRYRTFREEREHHDRWVEILTPDGVVAAAKELAPRWFSEEREDFPKAVEFWRAERYAALMRRINRERIPYP